MVFAATKSAANISRETHQYIFTKSGAELEGLLLEGVDSVDDRQGRFDNVWEELEGMPQSHAQGRGKGALMATLSTPSNF